MYKMHVFAAFYIREKIVLMNIVKIKHSRIKKNGLQLTILHSDRNSDAHFVYGIHIVIFGTREFGKYGELCITVPPHREEATCNIIEYNLYTVSPFVACNFQYVFFLFTIIFSAPAL